MEKEIRIKKDQKENEREIEHKKENANEEREKGTK